MENDPKAMFQNLSPFTRNRLLELHSLVAKAYRALMEATDAQSSSSVSLVESKRRLFEEVKRVEDAIIRVEQSGHFTGMYEDILLARALVNLTRDLNVETAIARAGGGTQ